MRGVRLLECPFIGENTILVFIQFLSTQFFFQLDFLCRDRSKSASEEITARNGCNPSTWLHVLRGAFSTPCSKPPSKSSFSMRRNTGRTRKRVRTSPCWKRTRARLVQLLFFYKQFEIVPAPKVA